MKLEFTAFDEYNATIERIEQAKLKVVQDANYWIETYFEDKTANQIFEDPQFQIVVERRGQNGFEEREHEEAFNFVNYWFSLNAGSDVDDLQEYEDAYSELERRKREFGPIMVTFDKLSENGLMGEDYIVEDGEVTFSLPESKFDELNEISTVPLYVEDGKIYVKIDGNGDVS